MPNDPLAAARTERRSTCVTSGPRLRMWPPWCGTRSRRRCSPRLRRRVRGRRPVAGPAVPSGDTFAWTLTRPTSGGRRTSRTWRTSPRRAPTSTARGARDAGRLVTTDHISRRARSRPTARRPLPHRARGGAARLQLYGSRRGNHEVMIRGTFANIRCATSWPRHRGRGDGEAAEGEQMSIYDASRQYLARHAAPGLGGKEYGSGSSRDWAAKARSCSACVRCWSSRSSGSTAELIGMGCCRCSTARASRRLGSG